MKKIPTIYVRDYTDPHAPVLTAVPDRRAAWVFAGEGVARRKHDGTCVLIRRPGRFEAPMAYSRRMVKVGKPCPSGFIEIEHDPTTGHRFGWTPYAQGSHAKAIHEALQDARAAGRELLEGTYELVGPKVNGNPEMRERHELLEHATAETTVFVPPADPRDARDAMLDYGIEGWEGIVWHHEDGRMAKLKVRDVI